MTELTLSTSEKEYQRVLAGEQKVITREIRPRNAHKFVVLNDELECTGIIPYETLRLVRKDGRTLTARITKQMLMEIEDENGDLIFYDVNGVTYQAVDIDITVEDAQES